MSSVSGKEKADEWGKIKNSLLKSGLPLESDVARIIIEMPNELGLVNLGVYYFSRKESELPLSVDFLVLKDIDFGPGYDLLELVFLLECKYRTRGTHWYFAVEPLGDPEMEFFISNLNTNSETRVTTLPVGVWPLNNEKLGIGGNGVEVYGNGERNEKSIEEGFHQLMFGAASQLLGRLVIDVSGMEKVYSSRGIDMKGRNVHTLVCPVLITIASLSILESKSVNEFEESKNESEVSTAIDLLVHSTPKPSMYVTDYITSEIFSHFQKEAEDLGGNYPVDISKIHTQLMLYSAFFPSRYYLTTLSSFPKSLQDYISFAESISKKSLQIA